MSASSAVGGGSRGCSSGVSSIKVSRVRTTLCNTAAYLLRGAALEDAWSSEGIDEDRDELLQEWCVYGTVNVVVDTVA